MSLKQSRVLNLPVLALPGDYRQDLALPQGILYVNPSRGVVEGFVVDVAVGDVVSERHFSRLKILDFKTRRVNSVTGIHVEQCIRVLNPPGSISLNSLTILNSLRKGYICVIGEEDLLPVAYLATRDIRVIYGQPDVGVVELKSGIEIALKVFKILKPTMVIYDYSSSIGVSRS